MDKRVKAMIQLPDGRRFYIHIKKRHFDKIDALDPLAPTWWERMKARFRKSACKNCDNTQLAIEVN